MLCFLKLCNVASLDVVCNELIDDVRYVGVYEFVNEFIYIYNVKCLAHINKYSDCACWWLHMIEICCNGVYIV